MLDIDKVLSMWEVATGRDLSIGTVRIDSNADMLVYKAKEYLSIDETGIISALYLRLAFKALLEETSFSLKDMLGYSSNEIISRYAVLKEELFSGEIDKLFKSFINLIIKYAKVLGKNFTEDQIMSINKIEDIISKSISNYNNKYIIHKEKFNDGDLVNNQNATILSTLFRFKYLQQFVDSLERSSEDNFICIALIDRTCEEEDTDYDKEFDSFFAYGIKNNGAVIVVSDRKILNSPNQVYKTRNPGRNFYNKVDYSWLPYFKLDEIKNNCKEIDNKKLITFNRSDSRYSSSISELFDDAGIIYTTLMMTLIYKQYFIDVNTSDLSRKYFASDIKYLPENTVKIPIVAGECPVVIPNSGIDAASYSKYNNGTDISIYNTGVFDHYLKRFPLYNFKLVISNRFIGDNNDANRLIWWNTRKAQADHIKEELSESYKNKYAFINDWFNKQIAKNFNSIVNYMITHGEVENINSTVSIEGGFCSPVNDKNLPIFWKYYKDGKDIDTFCLREQVDLDDGRIWSATKNDYTSTKACTLVGTARLCKFNQIIIEEDNASKSCAISLILRSYSDLKKFFNLDILPIELNHWVHMTSSTGFGCMGWEPYAGNSILDFTDPMNSIEDPFNNFACNIHLVISKRLYNKIKKLRNR